jgi:hypothetical protein
MSDGVTGNTTDSGSVESRFEPWSDNKNPAKAGFIVLSQTVHDTFQIVIFSMPR